MINFKGNLQLSLTLFSQMNTDVCEHYGWTICSYFWDKLMRNLTLLHENCNSMKTANYQTGFHKICYYDKFISHML